MSVALVALFAAIRIAMQAAAVVVAASIVLVSLRRMVDNEAAAVVHAR